MKELHSHSGFFSVKYSTTALSKERLARFSFYMIDTSQFSQIMAGNNTDPLGQARLDCIS